MYYRKNISSIALLLLGSWMNIGCQKQTNRTDDDEIVELQASLERTQNALKEATKENEAQRDLIFSILDENNDTDTELKSGLRRLAKVVIEERNRVNAPSISLDAKNPNGPLSPFRTSGGHRLLVQLKSVQLNEATNSVSIEILLVNSEAVGFNGLSMMAEVFDENRYHDYKIAFDSGETESSDFTEIRNAIKLPSGGSSSVTFSLSMNSSGAPISHIVLRDAEINAVNYAVPK